MRRALLTGPAPSLARYNLFDNLTPQYNDNGDPSPFTYGIRFFSDVAGRVVAIRFYKGLNNGGGDAHTVALYSASGSLLASVATASEPASGWVTTNLPTPVTITANTTYTVAVFFPAGHAVYSDTFFNSQYDSPPLHAYANGNGGNGVYNLADTLQFPVDFYNEGYFIDPILEVGETPPPPPPPPAIAPPPQASAAGLMNLTFNDEFETIDLYNPTTHPDGTWSPNEPWTSRDSIGYIDFGGLTTMMINQVAPGTGSNAYDNAAALAAIQDLIPLTQLDATTVRMRCKRFIQSEHPDVMPAFNAIAAGQSQDINNVKWVGCQLTTGRFYGNTRGEFGPPAYLECRLRVTPANIPGVGMSWWQYSATSVNNTDEIDLIETNDLTPSLWKTNFHGPAETSITHTTPWMDGQFHIFGMLWRSNRLEIYYDNVLDGVLDGNYYINPMRLMLGVGNEPYWHGGITVPADINETYLDLDYVRVWKA